MKNVRRYRALPSLIILTASIIVFGSIEPVIAANTRAAYVDPALRNVTNTTSVIVTARDSVAAAGAVQKAGGVVTSDLWIVNGVAARLTRGALDTLRDDPNVVTIIENKKVKASDWNGWMSDKRVRRGRFTSSSSIIADASFLPDGGFAIVTANGLLRIINADGTERASVQLPGYPSEQSPVAAADGTIYVVANNKTISAVSATGQILFTNSSHTTQLYEANGVAGADGTLYAVDSGATARAWNKYGTILWQQSVTLRGKNDVVTTPALGADNTLYFAAGGYVVAMTAAGVRWQVQLSSAGRPQLFGNTLYLMDGTSSVVALDSTTGTRRFTYTVPQSFRGEIAIGADGSTYFATQAAMYSLNSIGQVRWTSSLTGYAFSGGPTLSSDGSQLFVVMGTSGGKSESHAASFYSSNGANRWFNGGVDAVSQVVADSDGGAIFLSGSNLYRQTADKQYAKVKLTTTADGMSKAGISGSVVARLDDHSFEFHGRMPEHWSARKDVEATDRSTTYRLINPVSVDVGADQLHSMQTLRGDYIRGGDVGVAVVDSGVYWDPDIKLILGTALQRQFIGQADFVQSTCNSTNGLGAGIQYSGYCFCDHNYSLDGYGHGTHVSGIIDSKLLENDTGAYLGIAPEAKILGVRVLGNDGAGSYETVIKGIQYVVANKSTFNIRVMNLSLSAYATVPYFVDPLDRAVERAWQAGIVVVAAAGNTGPFAQTITVPGNDPYVVTAGAVSANRTAAYWNDDVIPGWSATGPTFDGFAKPEVVAPGSQIVSFMYNDPTGVNTQLLVKLHPDYSANANLFRMNGTSMSTAVTSGVVALMLQNYPALTPDQVKYRLVNTARPAFDRSGKPVFHTLLQGMGRLWAPDAVLAPVDSGRANVGMDINVDLAHGYDTYSELAYHYQGPIRRILSDDGTAYGYYATDTSGNSYLLGLTDLNGRWLDADAATRMIWGGVTMIWGGGLSWSGDSDTFSATRMIWGGTNNTWSSTRMIWGGTRMIWGGTLNWAGGNAWTGASTWGSVTMIWGGSTDAYATTRMIWGGSISNRSAMSSSSRWIDDYWVPALKSDLPPPAATTP